MRSTAIPLLAILCAACGPRAVPEPPAPVPAPPPPLPPVLHMDHNPPLVLVVRGLRVCVIRDGELAEVSADYSIISGDTLYQGLPLSHTFPLTGEYAGVAGWYVHNEPITFHGVRWIRYGVPRQLRIDELTRVGEYDDVGVYLEAGQTVPADYIYLPARPGCVFETYTRSATM